MIAGNGTLAAALELGWKEIDVTRVPFRQRGRGARLRPRRQPHRRARAVERARCCMEALESLALEGWKLEDLGFAPEDLAAWKRRQAPGRRRSSRPTTRTSRPSYLCPRCAYEWSGRPE